MAADVILLFCFLFWALLLEDWLEVNTPFWIKLKAQTEEQVAAENALLEEDRENNMPPDATRLLRYLLLAPLL